MGELLKALPSQGHNCSFGVCECSAQAVLKEVEGLLSSVEG